MTDSGSLAKLTL